jgi:hypothetical protein
MPKRRNVMSASRDKSQGIGFVYSIPKIRDQEPKVFNGGHPQKTQAEVRKEAMGVIRQNLGRLVELHHKLKEMLKEMDELNKKE